MDSEEKSAVWNNLDGDWVKWQVVVMGYIWREMIWILIGLQLRVAGKVEEARIRCCQTNGRMKAMKRDVKYIVQSKS